MLSVLYTTPHLSIALMSMVVGILSPAYSAWVLALFFGAYGMTYRGKPELTGARAWPLFQDWLRRKLDVALKRWCGGVTLEVTFDYDLDPSRKYVFGFHPHGMPLHAKHGMPHIAMPFYFVNPFSLPALLSFVSMVFFVLRYVSCLCCVADSDEDLEGAAP